MNHACKSQVAPSICSSLNKNVQENLLNFPEIHSKVTEFSTLSQHETGLTVSNVWFPFRQMLKFCACFLHCSHRHQYKTSYAYRVCLSFWIHVECIANMNVFGLLHSVPMESNLKTTINKGHTHYHLTATTKYVQSWKHTV